MKSTKTKPRRQSEATLRKQRDSAVSALADIERERSIKENAKLIGRCFKCENSFGPDRPSWWLYVKITAGGNWWPQAFSFEHKSDNSFEVRNQEAFTGVDRYDEITKDEFDAALVEFKTKLHQSLNGGTRMQPLITEDLR